MMNMNSDILKIYQKYKTSTNMFQENLNISLLLFDVSIRISIYRFYVDENVSYTLELEINADKGVVITKKMNGGNFSEANTFTKSDTMPNTEQQRYQFSFENSMEFRCITQQYLDILKREEEKLLCTRTGKHVYKQFSWKYEI